jgi:hypothetical protein
MNICDYTTLDAVKSLADTTGTTDDAEYLKMIQQASREIELISKRLFYPRIDVLTFDTPEDGDSLILPDEDLLSITTLKNGDGSTIPNTDYKLYPLNRTPKYEIVITNPTGWLLNSLGRRDGAIEITGIYGYVDHYADAWENTGAVLINAMNDAVTTSVSCTSGIFKVGDLIQIGAEWMYVRSIQYSTNDILTVLRGVNGSTAVSHLINSAISRYSIHPSIQSVCKRAVIAYNKLRSNPLGETIVADGVSYTTPRDVSKYIRSQMVELGFSGRGMI